MAAKIIILLALLILPSVIIAQLNKEAFSVELKIEKTNYSFGEPVIAVISIKNISGKKDSLTLSEFYDVFNCNITLLHDSITSFCVCAMPTTADPDYRVFQPWETYSSELSLSGACGNTSAGQFTYHSLLDTGKYSVETYMAKKTYPETPKAYYKRIYADKINFYVEAPNGNEKNVYNELKNIMDFSLEQYRDTLFMLDILPKLNEFTIRNIDTYSGDIAYNTVWTQSLRMHSYKECYSELSKFYLTNKPDGSKVYMALTEIYNNEFEQTGSEDKALEKVKWYADNYPDTRIKKEAIKIIQYIIK